MDSRSVTYYIERIKRDMYNVQYKQQLSGRVLSSGVLSLCIQQQYYSTQPKIFNTGSLKTDKIIRPFSSGDNKVSFILEVM